MRFQSIMSKLTEHIPVFSPSLTGLSDLLFPFFSPLLSTFPLPALRVYRFLFPLSLSLSVVLPSETKRRRLKPMGFYI